MAVRRAWPYWRVSCGFPLAHAQPCRSDSMDGLAAATLRKKRRSTPTPPMPVAISTTAATSFTARHSFVNRPAGGQPFLSHLQLDFFCAFHAVWGISHPRKDAANVQAEKMVEPSEEGQLANPEAVRNTRGNCVNVEKQEEQEAVSGGGVQQQPESMQDYLCVNSGITEIPSRCMKAVGALPTA